VVRQPVALCFGRLVLLPQGLKPLNFQPSRHG
jgi:hypothetical protein